jgi:Na+/H+-dicarboxylate symporter
MGRIKQSLSLQILIATIIGIVVGLLFGQQLQWIGIIGTIFIRLIQMSIVLLVLGHVIEAVGSIQPTDLAKLGFRAIGIFLVSSLLAAAFGILVAEVFMPGGGVDTNALSEGTGEAVSTYEGTVADTILNFIPSNIVDSLAQGVIVHVILFGIIFGMALGAVSQKLGDTRLLDLTVLFNKVIIKLITYIMKIAPVGICALLIATIGKMGVQIMLPLIKYLAVYGVATFVFLLAWFLVVCLYCRVSFIRLVRNMSGISLMAFLTTSSAVTLPTALKDSQDKLGVGERICKFIMPMGMSLNSTGSALFLSLTLVTIAQIYGIEFSTGQLLYLGVLSVLCAMANAAVPGAGLVALSIVVPPMGLPLESIALFAVVDWYCGMLRTILNVDADVFTAIMVAKSQHALDKDVFYGRKLSKVNA